MKHLLNALLVIALMLSAQTSGFKKDHFLKNGISLIQKTTTNSQTKQNFPLNQWIQIRNKASGKCLRYVGQNQQLVQADCFSWREAAWQIQPKPSVNDIYLINNMMGNFYLDNYANIATNGNGIFSWDKHGGIQQDWRVVAVDGGYKIVSVGTNKCIETDGNANNVQVKQNDCTGTDKQAFEFVNFPTPQRSTVFPIDRWVNIIHTATGKCIRYKGTNQRLILDDCANRSDFAWNLSFNGVDGSYFITSRVGNYLFDNYANLAHNENGMFSWTRHGGIQQHFYFRQLEQGNVQIITRGTSKCIDTPNTNNGVELRQWDCLNSQSQIFRIELQPEPTVPSSVPLNAWSQIVVKANGNCIKFNGNHVQLVQASCGNSEEFLWNVSWNSLFNTYYIVNKKANFLFDNYANAQHNGNGIFGWSRHGGIQQEFIITPVSGNFVKFTTKGSPKCVTLQNDNQNSGVVQWDCSGTDYQTFSFNPIESTINQEVNQPLYSNRNWQIVNRATGRCVRYENINVQLKNVDCYQAQEWQWNFSWNSFDNSWFIGSWFNNDYSQGYLFDNYANLLHNGNGQFSWTRHGGAQQHWAVVNSGDNTYQLIPKVSKKCLQINEKKTENWAPYIQSDCVQGENHHRYTLQQTPYPLNQYNGVPLDEWVQIANKASGKCLKFNYLNGQVVQATCADTEEFFWMFSWNSWDGSYFIANKKNPNGVFDNYANLNNNGNGIFSWQRSGSTQQHWFLRDFDVNGYFRIVAKGSVKCAQITSTVLANENAGLVQWECAPDASEQAWNFQGAPLQKITVTGYIRDATTNNLISGESLFGASVVFTNLQTNVSYNAVVNQNGTYSVTLPPGNYRRTATLAGYSTTTTTVSIQQSSGEANGINTVYFSPVFQGYRIVLTWGAKPSDLDARLRLPDGSEVFYGQKTGLGGVITLDVDNRNGFGPETITIPPTVKTGNFKFYVNRYTNDGQLRTSGAKVIVYQGGNQVKEYYVPADQEEATNWHVFNLSIDTNTITDINRLQNLV